MKNEFNTWTQYFATNAATPVAIDWDDEYQLSPDEYDRIYTSIRIFQRGEYSEGKHLMSKAKQAVKEGAPSTYIDALTLFIREEQRHAMILGRFMKNQQMPVIRQHWVDDIFRAMRRPLGLGGSILVLTVAEMVALAYYKALREATDSQILKRICDQIMWDEPNHLRFQASGLRMCLRHKPSWWAPTGRFLQKFLLAGTLALVWFQHTNVFRSGGYTFSKLWKSSFAALQDMWAFQVEDIPTEPYQWLAVDL
ncbi:MAG: ferritin-like domain-containing protein [Bacteroidia bacterium]